MTQALDTLCHSDCYFDDSYEPYQLSDGAIVGHVIYFDHSHEERQLWEDEFLATWDNSQVCHNKEPELINLICELNKTLRMALGRGFDVSELNHFATQYSRREWIKEAIKSEEYQKEILLELYSL